MIEENVVSAAGTHHQATEEELRRMIRDAGFVAETARHALPDLLLKLNSLFAIRAKRPLPGGGAFSFEAEKNRNSG